MIFFSVMLIGVGVGMTVKAHDPVMWYGGMISIICGTLSLLLWRRGKR